MPTSAPRLARALAREHLTAQIVAAARRQLTEVGPSELSVRAVARELAMSSSAVYRYVASRDELLTLLLVEVYNELGDVTEAAELAVSDRTDLHTRWMTLCRAIRAWARGHPHDYALVYGSPVPGYAAPPDTVPPATRVVAAFLRLLADIPWSRHVAGSAPVAPDLAHAIGSLRALTPSGTPDLVIVRCLVAWTAVFGTISFELFGHLVGAVDDVDAYADLAFGRLAVDLLLVQ